MSRMVRTTRKYEWIKNETKAIFKPATLWETKDTLTTVVKGNKVSVAEEADDEGVLGGLDYFKVQIIQCEDDENEYRIRSVAKKGSYLYSFSDQLSWSGSKKKQCASLSLQAILQLTSLSPTLLKALR